MSGTLGRDPLEQYAGFAALRDKWSIRRTSFHDDLVHWTMRLEGESFALVIGQDRGDQWFLIQREGGRLWPLPEILLEMGLWGDLSKRVDDRRLAGVLEENIAALLSYLAEKER